MRKSLGVEPMNVGSTGVHAQTTRQCLVQLNVQLNKLVPKSVDSIFQVTPSEKEALQGKIADLLQQVLSNEKSFAPEQRNNLMNIRDLAKKAEQMDLLSKPAQAAIKGIAAKTKEVGLSLYTAPRDFTIQTKEGPVEVNSDVLKANSSYFKKMIKSGMKESTTRSVELNISKGMVDFLMKCLHAPSAEQIDLPADNDLVFELVGFAMSHGFDNLIKKLEPAVTQFIDQQGASVVENGYAWADLLALQKEGSSPSTAAKWLADLTPHFLDNFEIPVKPSKLPGLFEIPIEHLNALFDEDRNLLKQLPLALDIKDQKDLSLFKEAFQKTKLESFLPIKLLCRMELPPDEEMSLHHLAKAAHIELDIKKVLLPSGTVFFGKELWDTYLGHVDDLPLPAGIGTLLASPCPAFPGRTWKDKFMLVLMPKTVDEQPLSLNRFRELAQHPKVGDNAANYQYTYGPILEEHGNKAAERSEWVLMSMDVIEGSRDLSYEVQEARVAAIPGCEIPDLLSAHVCILTHFIHTGERLYGEWTYTRCKETTPWVGRRYQTVVGGFGAAGLYALSSHSASTLLGAGALRKFRPLVLGALDLVKHGTLAFDPWFFAGRRPYGLIFR